MGRFRWQRAIVVRRGQPKPTHKPIVYKDEYVDVPEYPPILDLSLDARKKRLDIEYHEKIKSIKTVEEKLGAINLPRYYGWKSFMLKEGSVPYNSFKFLQHITRSHLRDFSEVRNYYSHVENEASAVLEELKSQIEDAIIFEHKYQRERNNYKSSPGGQCLSPSELSDALGKAVLQHINRIILAHLSHVTPHLLSSQVDTDARIESFWSVGGIPPSYIMKKSKQSVSWLKDKADEPVNRWIQYLGTPALQLRSTLPLSPVISLQDSENTEFEVPQFRYDPKVIGYFEERRHGTNIPGFWPGDKNEFGLLSYHLRGHMRERCLSYGESERANALHAQGILASYGWLHSQACYQGFSTYNELTYPLVTQTVLTDGKFWSFYVYQLNTTLLHSEHALENPRRNVCWATREMKLYEEINGNKVIGLNDDALKLLVKFYLNPPRVDEGLNLKPYLGEFEKAIADIPDEKRRCWLENWFKHMYSNRPRGRLPYEIYNWERIYKIKFNTRPMEARRRPFELRQDPWRRRYDDHQPRYIPKKFRPEDLKKKKWEDTYYPL